MGRQIRARGAWFEIKSPGGTSVRIAGVHLESGDNDRSHAKRKEQVENLFSNLQCCDKVLIGGDCNWYQRVHPDGSQEDMISLVDCKGYPYFKDVAEVLGRAGPDM